MPTSGSPRRRIRNVAILLLAAVLLLSLPEFEPIDPVLARNAAFLWNQDSVWESLEAEFVNARKVGCDGLREDIDRGFSRARDLVEESVESRAGPESPVYGDLEQTLFVLAPWVGVCPDRSQKYLGLVSSMRDALKDQSRDWSMDDAATRRLLYRLLYGGRAATEEVLLQLPPGSVPAVLPGEDEPSSTPSTFIHGVEVHSGDILVSRGGAPTSALIARGNDYPGNFSHVALLYVDSATRVPRVLESHIERGVTISSLEDYLGDVKLRLMVLRLRSNLPALVADPLLPHKAASRALAGAMQRHIPYDFEMDYQDTSSMFCSEVASAAYRQEGIRLWMGLSSISTMGIASWLAAFGVKHFETQEPSDLEYDPQLSVVAEWRDPETLFKDHVDNAVVEALLEGAEAGERLTYDWYLLPLGRVLKGYSVVLNLFGGEGPIPEGMSATGGLRHMKFNGWHEKTKEGVLRRVGEFRKEHGYTPPYWELLKMARIEKQSIR